VLLHAHDTLFFSTDYLLRHVMERWAAAGVAVEVVRGTDRFVEADAVVPHLDLSVVPDIYRAYLDRCRVALNRAVVDISKSRISANLVRPGDDWEGAVIVKTDRNFGGIPEARLAAVAPVWSRVRDLPARAMARLRRALPGTVRWRGVASMRPRDYPVYSSLREVPSEIFANSKLVVERFLPEADGDLRFVRYCYVLGDRHLSIRLTARADVVKLHSAIAFEEVETPEELLGIRSEIGLDFGKLDFTLRDGRVVLLDVTRTPGMSTLAVSGFAERAASHLAEGLSVYLG
jgi:hypothetical protein